MKIGTRLLLTLLPTVAVIMTLYAILALRQREALLLERSRAEAQVFSTAVGIAFAHAFRDLQFQDVQDILLELDDEPGIYAVVFYDPDGSPAFSSTGFELADRLSPASVRTLLTGDSVVIIERSVDDQRTQSVLRAVRDREGTVVGVLEVVQPLTFVEGDAIRTTRRFLLNTATLMLALAVLLTWLVRRYVGRPLEEFVTAINRVGEGETPGLLESHPRGGELDGAAQEFNRMVSRLQVARSELERESEERLLLQERVREKEHLADLGTLAAGVAHQVATPLSVIGGRAESLLRRGDRPPEEARSLEIIRKQTARITRIVRNLLQFARRPEPDIRSVDATASVERALELFAAEFAEAGIQVEHEAEGSVHVSADPELLEEVLITIIDNALHALREPGGPRELLVREYASGAETSIEIEDSGPGIPAEALPRIFEPFYTTRSGGTGLGLSIAGGIMEQMGGRLEVENVGSSAERREPGAETEAHSHRTGTVVRVVLPSRRKRTGDESSSDADAGH